MQIKKNKKIKPNPTTTENRRQRQREAEPIPRHYQTTDSHTLTLFSRPARRGLYTLPGFHTRIKYAQVGLCTHNYARTSVYMALNFYVQMYVCIYRAKLCLCLSVFLSVSEVWTGMVNSKQLELYVSVL